MGRWGIGLLLWTMQLYAQWCVSGVATSLNSPADDFAPVWDWINHRLLLSSTRQGASRIYVALWHDSTWGIPQELPGLAQDGHHLSYAVPVPGEGFYVCRYRAGRRQAYLTIARAWQQGDGKWYWEELPELHRGAEESFTAHPSLSPDGLVLVFASDRPGGIGGTDLWICYRQEDGQWGPPENLQVLNSPGNEITPFLLSSDTLYFASDGHGGAGGYDLYYSWRDKDGQWSPPEPLRELNTALDESDFCVLPFGDMALFARGGMRKDLDLMVARRCASAVFSSPPQPVPEGAP